MSDQEVLEELRAAARKAAAAGHYGDHLVEVVRLAVEGLVPANPDEVREGFMGAGGSVKPGA